MAAAAPSPLASSVEKANGAKLSRLLIDGGTTVLRTIFKRYHPPANLLADLHGNYVTLNNLLKKRVLHRPQWDLLFPPGGATPDSNTFDITLLFLLLTNICGLSRPLSFWHSKPPPSDTSLEANLARIKFFRNELYGHVTTTSVDTPTFSALWVDISAVLVALGLHQAEIDRLKGEHCGEEDYIDVLLEWADSEEDIKSQLRDISKSQTKVQHTVDEVRQTLQEQFKHTVKDLEQREKHRRGEILKKLAKIHSLKDIIHHTERYVEGTRLSIFAKVESWLDDGSSPNRVMVISGTAGMGKSVISAVTCQKMSEEGRLAGSHFCQHDRARHRNPKVMLQSLASHLADSLPDYKKALVEKLSGNLGVEINDMEVKDLFELLFEEPLTSLNKPGCSCLMVIDGIDECEYQERNELLDVIASYFRKLPLWIRFLVTTRPEINIADKLKCLHPLQLEQNNEENLKDIYVCLKKQLRHLLQSEYQEIILQELVRKSEGIMLYAHYLVNFIKENMPLLTPEQLDSTLPPGISDVYKLYFKRLETDLCKELKVTDDHKDEFMDRFMNFLSAVAAAREPLPLGFVSKLLLLGTCKSPSAVQRKVNVAIACVSALLPVQDGRIHFFHKSVKDWLIDSSYYGQHHFSVDEKEGHHVLSKLCIDELDDVKQKGVEEAQFSDTTKYALQHGVQHMLQIKEDERVCSLDEVVQKYVLNLELVYAKLCVNVTAASEDILCVQKQAGIKALFGEWQTALGTLLYLLRKHISTLTELPCSIFQTLLNEGGPELSSKSLNLLETRYDTIPFMEFLDKKDLQGTFHTRFQCSAAVTCFDVSPQFDLLVCECQDDTIQLWSLHTGKQLWKRHVKITKEYYLPMFYDEADFREPYKGRTPFHVATFYRSVVFHPTEDLVLPGILSHAYTIDGDLKPLFPSSQCRFTVCSISADKTKMLTDCPENATSISLWNLTDGSELTHFTWEKDVFSFAWSRDERLLAISTSRSIRLVDVLDGFKTLAETAIPKDCGIIKFSPDCRFLFGCHFLCESFVGCTNKDIFRFDVKMERECNFSLGVFPGVSYKPWEFESCSETGFIFGDPFCFPSKSESISMRPQLAFVINKQSVLRVSSRFSVIEMLHPKKIMENRDRSAMTVPRTVVFSLNGHTCYVFTANYPPTVMVWDISSGESKAEKNIDFACSFGFVAVRTGVLFGTSTGTLELWNVEMSECIRSWAKFGDIIRVSPISEERVACDVWDSSKVIILNTTSGDIVSTITIHGEFVACNSKFQVITTGVTKKELQMQCGEVVLWKISTPFVVFPHFKCNTFSPTEQYCLVCEQPKSDDRGCEALYVFDADLGKTLHMLRTADAFYIDCKFVNNEECIFNIHDVSRGHCLRLFNIKSGDLLSEITVEGKVCSLAACPPKRLIAIGLNNSEHSFHFLKVKLPRRKDSMKNKR